MGGTLLSRHALWLSQLCLASLMVVGREALATVPPSILLIARLAGGAAIFGILARQEGSVRIAPADYRQLVLCALFGATLNQVFFVYGLQRTTATHASALSATIPVLTLLFAASRGKEAIDSRKAGGIALGLCGALGLVLSRDAERAGATLSGDLMIGANCVCWAMFLTLMRDLAVRYSPMFLASRFFMVGAGIVLPFCIAPLVRHVPLLDRQAVAYLGFIVLVPTVGAYAFNQLAMRRFDASVVAVHWYLLPVFGILGAALRLDEPIGPRVVLFSAMICIGIVISRRTHTVWAQNNG